MFKKKLPAILSSFEKTISQLDTLSNENVAAIASNTAQIERLNEESNALSSEATKANRVAERLREILK